jgi:hypothetical protein
LLVFCEGRIDFGVGIEVEDWLVQNTLGVAEILKALVSMISALATVTNSTEGKIWVKHLKEGFVSNKCTT